MARLLYEEDDNVCVSVGLPVSWPVVLTADGDTPVRRFIAGARLRAPILVPRPGGPHVVVAPPEMDVLVGCPLLGGISTLEDQDQLRIGHRLFRYTTWDWIDPLRREPFEGKGEVLCPVDMQPIAPGHECVYCPTCGYAMHAECVTPALTSCLACECPVAHTEDQAMEIAAARGGLR